MVRKQEELSPRETILEIYPIKFIGLGLMNRISDMAVLYPNHILKVETILINNEEKLVLIKERVE